MFLEPTTKYIGKVWRKSVVSNANLVGSSSILIVPLQNWWYGMEYFLYKKNNGYRTHF